MGNQVFFSANLDLLGFTASIACALHCTAIPLLISVGSIGSIGFLKNPALEAGILILGALVALCSLLPAYYKKHHNIQPAFLVAVGFLIIIAGKFMDHSLYEGLSTAGGATLIATAHYRNWKLLKKMLSARLEKNHP